VVPDQRSQTAHLQTKVQNNEIEASKTQDVTTLTQLLNLMDTRQNLVVRGNKSTGDFDLALTRPGRFDKVIYLDLPAKRKRFELFKFYSRA
jgi:SpoVK/Ycf46/Vps4 family AAA+-type ATPase